MRLILGAPRGPADLMRSAGPSRDRTWARPDLPSPLGDLGHPYARAHRTCVSRDARW
jgi:hypothetical protein